MHKLDRYHCCCCVVFCMTEQSKFMCSTPCSLLVYSLVHSRCDSHWCSIIHSFFRSQVYTHHTRSHSHSLLSHKFTHTTHVLILIRFSRTSSHTHSHTHFFSHKFTTSRTHSHSHTHTASRAISSSTSISAANGKVR